MTLGYVLQRFVNADGSPTQDGYALLEDKASGMSAAKLCELHFIAEHETLVRVVERLGGVWQRQERMYESTASLMTLYARHQDCAIVAAITGLKPIGVYQRLRRAGWSGIRGGFRRRKPVEGEGIASVG